MGSSLGSGFSSYHNQHLRFVGRKKEIARLRKSLLHGETIIISGKYGIGRTRLVRHIAGQNKDHWRFVFVDYSRTAAEACRQVFLELFPKQKGESPDLPYKSLRFRIAGFRGGQRKTIIVFDNIAKLSHQKLELLRYLKLRAGFQYIAIVESFLPDEQLIKLRGCLGPASTLILDHLPFGTVKEFFADCSEKYQLGLRAADIHGIAKASGGYPLSMTDLIASELRRRGLAVRGC